MKTLPSFAAQQGLFRAYDIRGERQYFTTDFVAALAVVFAQLYKTQSYYCQNSYSKSLYPKTLYSKSQYRKSYLSSNKTDNTVKATTVVIGYDVRIGSDTIANTLADTLQNKGLIVINLGLVTTPMMAFWAQQYDGHGIMVTASHSAKDTLGIKWLLSNTSPSSLEIQSLYQQLSSPPISADVKQNHTTDLPAPLIANRYIEAVTQALKTIYQRNINASPATTSDKLNLTLVIDCMNGATSNVAQPLFARFCQRVIMLNDTANGDFPIGNPDPTEPNRLAELQQAVIVHQADMGFAFDGDGDRLMIVDNSGKVIVADHLLYLLAQVAITDRPTHTALSAPKVLFDIKCSHHLPHLLNELGAVAMMTRTGSSLLRQQLQASKHEQAPIFAGELSGHFIFNDGYFIAYDDAMYAGLRLLHWLAYTAPTLDILVPTISDITDNLGANILTATDVWGEPRASIPPYQLTDITQKLPTLVSSADHYLPLSQSFLAQNNGNSCTFIEHLVEYCHYLLRLVHDESLDNIAMQHSIFMQSISCQCFSAKAPMLKTKSEARQLLPPETKLCTIDGLRLDFAHGFGVVRRSNTSNSLTVRFAGDSRAEMQKVKARFVALCQLFDKDLAAQMAAIEAV
ncbi:phosphomannomutase [Psychrobacter sp. AH5]|uniref:phosphomannomutase n=1 Tax=Psychrobacter sp. AH5 TaxID=2937433 RepID=UPI003341FF7F